MALLDKLNKQRQQQPQQQMGQTQAAAKLLQAKSGKAGTAQAPVDQTAEQGVAQQVEGMTKQAAQQGQMQGLAAEQQSAGIEQQRQATSDNFDVARKQLMQNRDTALADMQLKAVQAAERLGLDKQKAAMEARLFEKRIMNEKYIQELQQEGAIKRLKDQNAFKIEMQNQIYGDDLANLLRSNEYNNILNSNQREFDEWLNRLSTKDAWRAAIAAVQSTKTQGMVSGLQSGLQAGSTNRSFGSSSGDTQTTTTPDTQGQAGGVGKNTPAGMSGDAP